MVGGVVQVVEHLPSKLKDMSLNPSTAKNYMLKWPSLEKCRLYVGNIFMEREVFKGFKKGMWVDVYFRKIN
jgi:hypothetical protein